MSRRITFLRTLFVSKLYNGVKYMGVFENVKHGEAGIPINSWSWILIVQG